MDFQIMSLNGALLCAAFFFAGIVDAVCGGGGLLTLPMLMTVGIPVRLVTGTNQCSIFFGGITSFLRFLRGGHIHWKTALPVIPMTVIGSTLGARLNLFLPQDTLKAVMIVLLPVVAAVVLLKRNFGIENHADELTGKRIALSSLFIGLIVGGYQGFYGAGAGTFFLIAFAILDRLDLITASGNTKVVSVCSNIAACVTYVLSGAVIWQAVLAATVFNIAGNYLGSGFAMTKGAKVIRPMFLCILAVLFAKIILSLFF